MAVAYASHQTATSNTMGAGLTITKPTSLAVGDLMIAFLWGGRNAGDWSTLSGWTKLGSAVTTDGTDANMTVLAKVADSGDTAASDFTFTPHASHEEKFGLVARITGTFSAGIGSLIVSDFDTDVTSSATGGVTPVAANSLLLMGVINHTAAAAGGGNAVTNNNPSWTTQVADFVNTAVDMGYNLATATFTVSTATGGYSWSNGALSGACLISVSESTDVTVSPTVISTTMNIIAPTVTGGATVTPAVIGLTATVQAPTVTTAEPKWKNPDKSSAPSWSNPDKS